MEKKKNRINFISFVSRADWLSLLSTLNEEEELIFLYYYNSKDIKKIAKSKFIF